VQSTHTVCALDALLVPAGQSMHEVARVALLNVRAGHGSHAT
jgi:hypothetical protein